MYYAVFDVGGSSIKHALMDREGNFLKSGSVETPKDDINEFIETIGRVCDAYKSEKELRGAAFSMPCPLDPKTGKLNGGGAIQYIYGHDVIGLIRKRTGLHVRFENDGNCAGLAEGFMGNAVGCDNYVVMVIGSGIGGTIIINGKVVHGAHLYAGEFGCMIIDDMLKHPLGEIFSVKAATGWLANNTAKALGQEEGTLSGLDVFRLAEEGNEIVQEELRKFYKYLAVGIFNIQYTVDPEKFLIGGAISQNQKVFDEVNALLKDMKDTWHVLDIKIEPCKFLGEANLIGALYNFIERENR